MDLFPLSLVLLANLVLPSPRSLPLNFRLYVRDDISCGPATSATNSDTAAQDPTSDATAIESEFTTTWTTTNSDGSVETNSGVVSQSGSSLTTITTFAPDATSEYTTSWTTTNSDGSVATNSGVVSQSGTSFTTITTFEPPVVCRRDDISCGPATSATNSDTAAQQLTSGMTVTETEFASTWVVTKSDGSVFTESVLSVNQVHHLPH